MQRSYLKRSRSGHKRSLENNSHKHTVRGTCFVGLLQVDIDIDGLLSFDPMTSSKFTIDGDQVKVRSKGSNFQVNIIA